MRAELERFEQEKVEDFRMGVETYLESAVEAQKEVRWVSTQDDLNYANERSAVDRALGDLSHASRC